jgi:tetratricopeptide (TPR) repeat protein
VQYATFKAIGLLGLGRYGEAWASIQCEVVDQEHPFGRLVRDLGIGLYLTEVFDNAGAVQLLADVAERARALHRGWLEDLAEVVKGLALARLGRAEDVEWGRFDVDAFRPAATRARVAGARAALAIGALEDALSRAHSALECALERDAMHEKASALLVAAQSLVGLGRPSEALGFASEGLTLAQEKGYVPLMWQLLAVRARALATDQPENAERDRKAATALVRELAEGIHSPEQRRGFLAYSNRLLGLEFR